MKVHKYGGLVALPISLLVGISFLSGSPSNTDLWSAIIMFIMSGFIVLDLFMQGNKRR
jgi:hypothetical protein